MGGLRIQLREGFCFFKKKKKNVRDLRETQGTEDERGDKEIGGDVIMDIGE